MGKNGLSGLFGHLVDESGRWAMAETGLSGHLVGKKQALGYG